MNHSRDKIIGSTCRKITAWLAGLLFMLVPYLVSAADADTTNASPRQLYNDGTKKLREGKLQEAEACLQSAVARQDAQVQGTALYNLGETRFREGAVELDKAPDSGGVRSGSQRAAESAGGAIQAADKALAGEDVLAMVEAYQRGRGARKELKGAIGAVKAAMEKYNSVLTKWQRASGDFKSDFELVPSDTDAKTNSEVMDENIARLIDKLEMMMQAAAGLGQQRSDLKKKMDELKKKMPQDKGDQFKGGEDDDDDEEDGKKPKEPKEGMEEPQPKSGKEMTLSYEEASRLLDMLKLDTNRKLPLGGTNGTPKPKDRKGRDW